MVGLLITWWFGFEVISFVNSVGMCASCICYVFGIWFVVPGSLFDCVC